MERPLLIDSLLALGIRQTPEYTAGGHLAGFPIKRRNRLVVALGSSTPYQRGEDLHKEVANIIISPVLTVTLADNVFGPSAGDCSRMGRRPAATLICLPCWQNHFSNTQ